MADRLGSSISFSSTKSSQWITATFLPFVFVVSFCWCILPFHSILPRLVQAEGDAHISISNTTGGQRRGPALSFFGIDNSTSSSISSGISDRTEATLISLGWVHADKVNSPRSSAGRNPKAAVGQTSFSWNFSHLISRQTSGHCQPLGLPRSNAI